MPLATCGFILYTHTHRKEFLTTTTTDTTTHTLDTKLELQYLENIKLHMHISAETTNKSPFWFPPKSMQHYVCICSLTKLSV